ncbi:hypothetical protein ACN6MY_10965 [Peribacillus sp. B-H-3]|uniref:hypothetical protein n=1 Tax=Peribacillus sp. B-H-3 TaxID=3400420 RepID=UPI003B01C6B1
MKYILVGFLAFILLSSGCSPRTESESYAATMRINGNYYDAVENESQESYTIDKEIGKIEKKVPPTESRLKEDFVSNYLDEGTVIYASKEDKDVFLVKKEGVYQIFKRR